MAYIIKHKQLMEEEVKKFEYFVDVMTNWQEAEIYIASFSKENPLEPMLISTMGVKDEDILHKMLKIAEKHKKLNLSFNIEDAFENDRDESKLSLRDIRNYGLYWTQLTGRTTNINYYVTNESATPEKLNRLMDLFDADYFSISISGPDLKLFGPVLHILLKEWNDVKLV